MNAPLQAAVRRESDDEFHSLLVMVSKLHLGPAEQRDRALRAMAVLETERALTTSATKARSNRALSSTPGPRILCDPPAAQILCGVAAIVGAVGLGWVAALLAGAI